MGKLVSNLYTNKYYSASNVSTWSAPCLKRYYDLFYPNDKKHLTGNLVAKLTPLSLAVWYMGDGSLNRYTPVIHVGKQVNLADIVYELNKKFNLNCENKTYFKEQHIRIHNVIGFFKTIGCYLLEEFSYKVPDNYRINIGSYWDGSSIYTVDSDKYKIMSLEDREKIVSELCAYFKSKGFPYPRYNKRKRKEDCLRLKNYSGSKDYLPNYGSRTCNHYMTHRYNARRYNNDPMNHWRDENLFKKFMENRLLYAGSKITDSVIRTGMKLKGVPTNFFPVKAKDIYEKYLPNQGTALDFSAGYGGRLLGFMTSSKNGFYTGVEPSKASYEGLVRMKDECSEFFKELNSENINIINAPFEDISKTLDSDSFDLSFSSPPYFGLEIYSDEDTQSIIRYPKYSEWLKKFWFFVIQESLRILKPGGHFIYTIGNYSEFNLIEDTLEYLKSTNFVKCDFDHISYKNVYKNSHKKETVFIFKKPSLSVQ